MNQTYSSWADAKHTTMEASLAYGFSYIAGRKSPYYVVTCERAEEAPKHFFIAFKDGVEQ